MSRLRQNNAQNYNTSPQINAEFENLVRYINSAEYGNKTLAELLDIMFTDEGVFDPQIQLRLDSSTGIEYRAGSYTDSEEGWILVVPVADIRGISGSNLGTFGEPIFESKFQFTASGGETLLDLAHDATTIFLVYLNGLIQVEGGGKDYTTDDTGGAGSLGAITFNSALSNSDEVVIYLIQSGGNIIINRLDFLTTGPQTNFGVVFGTEDSLQVYLNGVLQLEGGGEDYVLDEINDLVVFNTPVPDANDVSIITAAPSNVITVTGLMTEAGYTNQLGYIPYAKLVIEDDDIPVAKIATLVATLLITPDFERTGTTPAPIKDFWIDTSSNPAQLKFYDGSQYLSANPASQVPTFTVSDALKVLQVDVSGTVLQFGSVDLSALIPKTEKASANGVASLDSNARIIVSQLPVVIAYETYDIFIGSVTNQSERMKRIYKHQVTLSAISMRTDSGGCDIQIEIDGVPTGPVYSVTTTPNEVAIASPIDVNAVANSKKIGFVVTSNSAGTNLDVAITAQMKSQ